VGVHGRIEGCNPLCAQLCRIGHDTCMYARTSVARDDANWACSGNSSLQASSAQMHQKMFASHTSRLLHCCADLWARSVLSSLGPASCRQHLLGEQRRCSQWLSYRSLGKYCTTTSVRIRWKKYLETAEQSWGFPSHMIVPCGAIFRKATVLWTIVCGGNT
jgi:hypothetical protein